MDTKTLDSKLRTRGAEKLKRTIDEAYRVLGLSLSQNKGNAYYAPSGVRPVGNEGNQDFNVGQALWAIQKATIAYLTPYAEQAEIDEFMVEVQRLGQEVESLREGLE